MRRVWPLLGAGCLAVVLVSCSSDSSSNAAPPPPKSLVVDAKNMEFKPETASARVGQTVAWRFVDRGIAHDVKGQGFQSPTQSKGSYTHTFTAPGTYPYVCTLHPGMEGTVVVR